MGAGKGDGRVTQKAVGGVKFKFEKSRSSTSTLLVIFRGRNVDGGFPAVAFLGVRLWPEISRNSVLKIP
jgi:hypothetical protein